MREYHILYIPGGLSTACYTEGTPCLKRGRRERKESEGEGKEGEKRRDIS